MTTLAQIKKVLKWINSFKLFELSYNNKSVGGISKAQYFLRNDVLVIYLITSSVENKIVVKEASDYAWYNTPNGLTLVAENKNYHKEFTIIGLHNPFSS